MYSKNIKKCKRCFIDKDINLFFKHKQMSDGHLNICKECISAQIKKFKSKNIEHCKKQKAEINKRYNKANREKKNQHNKVYLSKIKHTEEYKKKHSQQNTRYDRRRKESDISYKLKLALRTRTSLAVSGRVKSGSSIKDLGCAVEYLKKYIESKFTDGMNWDNYGKGGWHIDHIIPLSHFNLSDREQFMKACHYTNLQPSVRTKR